MARSDEFDLLVLDLGLPDIDGLTVLTEVRRSRNDIPVIILTARDGVMNTVAGLEGGADDYVTKPFKFEELLARVKARHRLPATQARAAPHPDGSWHGIPAGRRRSPRTVTYAGLPLRGSGCHARSPVPQVRTAVLRRTRGEATSRGRP
ncbi:MAG: response regulator [Nitriliruptorales bacterium]|nr:response regulator [Nitriliruptorales bacterium]